jgi:hypothetical protein
MEYLDIDLEIGSKEGDKYPLAVLRSPVGEVQATPDCALRVFPSQVSGTPEANRWAVM